MGVGNRERYQAPVILNLTTGQSNEMRIYDPDLPFSEYEIAPIQATGTFSFASCAGYTGRRDTCSHTCTVGDGAYRARNCGRIDLCRLSRMWGFRMAASHLLLFLASSVRIFGQSPCYDAYSSHIIVSKRGAKQMSIPYQCTAPSSYCHAFQARRSRR